MYLTSCTKFLFPLLLLTGCTNPTEDVDVEGQIQALHGLPSPFPGSGWCPSTRRCVSHRIAELNTQGGGDIEINKAFALARAAVHVRWAGQDDFQCVPKGECRLNDPWVIPRDYPCDVDCTSWSGGQRLLVRNVTRQSDRSWKAETHYVAGGWPVGVDHWRWTDTGGYRFVAESVCRGQDPAVHFQGYARSSQDDVNICWGGL